MALILMLWVLSDCSIALWLLSDLERWRLTAPDKFEPNGRTDAHCDFLSSCRSQKFVSQSVWSAALQLLGVQWQEDWPVQRGDQREAGHELCLRPWQGGGYWHLTWCHPMLNNVICAGGRHCGGHLEDLRWERGLRDPSAGEWDGVLCGQGWRMAGQWQHYTKLYKESC